MTDLDFQGWRVPPLRGWALRLYQGLWWLLFAAALTATALGAIESRWSGPDRIPLLRAGINYTRDAGPGIVVFDVTSAQARQAGIDGGERILSINDAGTIDAGLDEVIDTPDGGLITLRVVEPGSADPREVRLQVGAEHLEGALRSAGFTASFMAGWTLGGGLLTGLLGMLASILLYRGDRTNPVAALLALIPLLTSTASFPGLPISIVMAILATGTILLPIALLTFPDGRFATRTSLVLLTANLLWAPVAIWSASTHAQGALVLLAASAAAAIPRLRRTAALEQRLQLRWAMLGFAGAAIFSLGLLACLRLQYLRDDLWYVIINDMAADVFDVLYTVALWGGLIVALLRYRLYDADVVVTRSAVWAIAAPLLAFFFAATIEVLKVALGPVLGNDMVIVPSAGALTALLIAPVGGWIERRVEFWSRRDLIALTRELPAAARDLSENDDADLLARYACRAVARAMKTTRTLLLLNDHGRLRAGAMEGTTPREVRAWLARTSLAESPEAVSVERADPLFPVRVALPARPAGELATMAWLLVGPRPDGSVQDRDARAALAEIAPALGRAVHVVSARQRRQAALLARLGLDPAAPRKSRKTGQT